MVYGNPQDFVASLKDWARVEVRGGIDEIKVAMALDTFRVMNLATPVGNPRLWKSLMKGYKGRKKQGKRPKGYVGGTARASWFATDSREGTGVPVKGKYGNPLSDILGMKHKPSIWVANNLPYIQRIMEEGWSTQAPSGTFSAAFLRLQQKWGAG